MEYRTLGRTGLKISAIGLGTWLLPENDREKTTSAMIDRAIELGCNFIDTADSYHQGESEVIVGKALHNRRDDIVLATKCWNPTGPGPNDRGLSRKHIMQACEASLKRLQTDYIDLYQAHSVDPDTPIDETVSAFDDLVRQGKARYVGCSNWQAWRLCKALWVSDCCNLARMDSVQPPYSLLVRDAERELFPLCLAEGVGVVCYSPLAQGALSGKYGTSGDHSVEGRLKTEQQLKRFFGGSAPQVIKALMEVHSHYQDFTMAQAALGWVLANPAVTSAIVGASRVAQVEENMKAVMLHLAPEHVEFLNNSGTEE